ncbi:MAG: 2-dehydropantoate 2-reductase [Bacillota bacterium]|nr:2-dehydropantoate 2-reductase [Bacillota bacterium]MDW7676421.1 2-dehydropantoate 2-reductase [Bacillota bacterium]
MKIAVVGAGAMGCLFGGSLSDVGNEVYLVDVWQEHVDTINQKGLTINGVSGDRRITSIRATTNASEIGICELVIIFVKAPSTKMAVQNALSLVGAETVILTLQNGLGNVEAINEVVGADKVVAGVTAHGSTLVSPGVIRHAGEGLTVIGSLSERQNERIEKIRECFRRAGFETEIDDNVIGLIWGKLMANIGINALTAITGLKNGQLLDFPGTEELLEEAVKEAMAVAKAREILLKEENPVAYVKRVCRKTAENRSSMLQDISRGNPTEINVINGAIVDEGTRLGIDTPVNKVLTLLVRTLENKPREASL